MTDEQVERLIAVLERIEKKLDTVPVNARTVVRQEHYVSPVQRAREMDELQEYTERKKRERRFGRGIPSRELRA